MHKQVVNDTQLKTAGAISIGMMKERLPNIIVWEDSFFCHTFAISACIIEFAKVCNRVDYFAFQFNPSAKLIGRRFDMKFKVGYLFRHGCTDGYRKKRERYAATVTISLRIYEH